MHLQWINDFDPEERKVRKNILSPRGSAKTTLVCLGDVLHRSLYATERYSVIFSSVDALAKDKLRDIRTELLNNDGLIRYFDIQPTSKYLTDELRFNTIFGDAKIKSQSFLSQIRGLKEGENRPSRFLFDDITHSERAFSEEQREKAERQFNTDIHNAGTPTTNYINIATALHEADIPQKLKQNPLWTTYTYRAVEEWPVNQELWDEWTEIMRDIENPNRVKEGDEFFTQHQEKMEEGSRVLWPEREDILFLQKEILEIGERAFNSEKQMKPFNATDCLFKTIHWVDTSQMDFPRDEWLCYYGLDPATSSGTLINKSKASSSLSDSSRVIIFKNKFRANNIVVYQDITNRDSISEIIEEMFELDHHFQFDGMFIEGDLFRDSGRALIKSTWDKMLDEGRYRPGTTRMLNIKEVMQAKRKGEKDKLRRIYRLEPSMAHRHIVFSTNISQTFKDQLSHFPNCSKFDALDALEIAVFGASGKMQLRSIEL